LLRSPKAHSRLVAAKALSHLGDQPRKTTIPVLTELLRNKEVEIRIEAAWALQGIGLEAKVAVPALIELLRDEDEEAQMVATRTLEEMGPAAKAAIPALRELLRNGPTGLRKDAADALKAIEKQTPAEAEKKR